MKFSGSKRRNKIKHIFRKPKTLVEMKANQDEDAKHGRRRDVPSAWDDITTSSRGNRNWKKYRKSKWK